MWWFRFDAGAAITQALRDDQARQIERAGLAHPVFAEAVRGWSDVLMQDSPLEAVR